MAHLSNDSLPSDFDVVIEGTGLIESIVAAAVARCGKSVLHLDRNGFYGGVWASLMHKELQDCIETSRDGREDHADLRENVITVHQPSGSISNIVQTVHGSEEVDIQNTALEQSQVEPLLSWNTLEPLKRRLVYDLCPKVLACRGMMVDLLTKSGCSRYVEFKAVSKICIYQSGQVVQVPCSRADVFESKLVSMMEKRKMMKFLSHCSNFEKEIKDLDELKQVTFEEYLRQHNLSENLVQYVLLCIAMTEGTVPALKGLQAAKLFLNSLGRFDNAPFLYPIFGGGELPQAFCRCCAVYGGVYCLKRSIASLCTSEHAVSGITCSSGQQISCRAVICNASILMKTYAIEPSVRISRAIIITDGPIHGTEGKLTLLTIPPLSSGPSQTDVVQLLQLDSSTNTAVDGTYMTHLMCRSRASARDDLESSIRLLYNIQSDSDCNVSGPRVLWSLYFNLDMCTVEQGGASWSADLPSNLFVTSDPDATRSYESAVQEAEMLFRKICPDDDFLQPPQAEKDS